MTERIRYPGVPRGINNLDRFLALKANWDFSHEKLRKLNTYLNDTIDSDHISIVVAGSYGRLDAHPESDLDYMILTHRDCGHLDPVKARISEVAAELEIKMPNPTGVFSEIIPIDSMVETIGSREDDLFPLAQRMLLLMEARPIYNETVYRNAVDKVLRKYLELVIDNPNKEALFLLNDIIRYFRSICVNYQFNFWKNEQAWVMRNVKLRHSRIIMYGGLLFLVLNASKNVDDKFSYLSSKIGFTPLERIVHVYQDNDDRSFERVLGMYDVFTRKISSAEVRDALRVEYEQRYSNPYYAELKVNSDNLQTELTRFIHAQKGRWTDQIFEYLIF